MSSSSPVPRRTAKRRNRHGRGARGEMIPPSWGTQQDPLVTFASLVSRIMSMLPRDVTRRLEDVEVLNLDVPTEPQVWPSPEAIAPLCGTHDHAKNRVFLYRWPLVSLARREKRPLFDVVADRLALELSGLWRVEPEWVDPFFGMPRPRS